MKTLSIDGSKLLPEDVVAVSHDADLRVTLAPEAAEACRLSRQRVEAILASGEAIYGVNTGFGDLAHQRVPDGDLRTLQVNLVRSHAAGAGAPLPGEVVRGAMLLRANTLAKGASGVGPELVETLLALLAHDVVPVVPEHGSLGASGDLAPLAHMALVVLGEGEAFYQGRRMPGGEALEAAGLRPRTLVAKEGLALLNGTPVETAIGCLALTRARRLLASLAVAGAMTTEALRGSDGPFRTELAELRGHAGHVEAAALLTALMKGSTIREDHRECKKVQDPYSLRCFPQVLGAGIDAVRWIHGVVSVECNAATDNPLIIGEEAVTGGNFHGAPVAYAFDLLAIVLTDMASISERRTFRLLTRFLSELPPFLTRASGLNSGMMIPQYTQAALVAECKLRSHPASVDSIPSSADQEDHVSMGMHAARKALEVVRLAETVVATEVMAAAQALEFLRPLEPGHGSRDAYHLVRERVPPLEEDREMASDMEAVRRLLEEGALATVAARYAPAGTWTTLSPGG